MTDVVILCAGQGKRLKPLTIDKPKPMIDVGGKPIIHWIFDALKDFNIERYIVVTGYRSNILESYIKTYIDLPVIFQRQYEYSGTSDAIALVEDLVSNDFIVLAGDTIFLKEDLEKLYKVPNSLLYTKQTERLHEYGTLCLDDIKYDYSSILHIFEKDTKPISNYVNCSAYHFDKRIFKFIKETPIDNRFREKIITNSINLFIDADNMFKGIYIEKLLEITYPKDIKIVEKELCERKLL